MILLMHILSSIIFAVLAQLSLSGDLQALAKPKRISLELLKHLLSTVLACRPVATEHLIGTFETVSSALVCTSQLLLFGLKLCRLSRLCLFRTLCLF